MCICIYIYIYIYTLESTGALCAPLILSDVEKPTHHRNLIQLLTTSKHQTCELCFVSIVSPGTCFICTT